MSFFDCLLLVEANLNNARPALIRVRSKDRRLWEHSAWNLDDLNQTEGGLPERDQETQHHELGGEPLGRYTSTLIAIRIINIMESWR